jgi:hypothetical protein
MGFPIVSTPLCTPDHIIVFDQHVERLTKPSDTVGQPNSAEIYVSHMPSLKAKKLGKLPQEKF